MVRSSEDFNGRRRPRHPKKAAAAAPAVGGRQKNAAPKGGAEVTTGAIAGQRLYTR